MEEVNLAQNVSALRKALGESPGENLYIATIPGKGYRFVGEVREVGGAGDEIVVERHTRAQIVIRDEKEDETEVATTTRTEIMARASQVAIPSSPLEANQLLIEGSLFRRRPVWAVLGIVTVAAVIAVVAIRQDSLPVIRLRGQYYCV